MIFFDGKGDFSLQLEILHVNQAVFDEEKNAEEFPDRFALNAAPVLSTEITSGGGGEPARKKLRR